MSNGRRWTRTTPASNRRALESYAAALSATGMEDREVARAYFYAERYGLDSMGGEGDGCVTFDEPNCGDWNCVQPGHQVLVKH